MLSAFTPAYDGAEPRAADPSAVTLSEGRRKPEPSPEPLWSGSFTLRLGVPQQAWLASRTDPDRRARYAPAPNRAAQEHENIT
jgi:hypothetical protein